MRKLLMSLLMAGSLLGERCRRRPRGRRFRTGSRFGAGRPIRRQQRAGRRTPSAPAADASAPATAASAPAASAAAAAAAPAAPTAPFSVDSSKINSGDTAWMLTSTALVLFMTIPGLALFYGGMVRKKNVLATLMQSFAITCVVTIVWVVVGYSLAFTPGNSFIGGFSRVFMHGHELHPRRQGDHADRQPPGPDDPGNGLLRLSDDVRDHHAGADHRCVCRPDEVLGDAGVHDAVVDHRLLADRAHGLGTDRLAGYARASSTSQAARWCTSTPVSRVWCAAWCSASASATARK